MVTEDELEKDKYVGIRLLCCYLRETRSINYIFNIFHLSIYQQERQNTVTRPLLRNLFAPFISIDNHRHVHCSGPRRKNKRSFSHAVASSVQSPRAPVSTAMVSSPSATVSLYIRHHTTREIYTETIAYQHRRTVFCRFG